MVDAGDAEAGRNGLGALPGDGVGLGTDWVRFVARPVLEFQTSEAPALRTACEGENAVGNPCVDQRLRADDAAGASRTGHDDQSFGRVDEVGETVDEFGSRAGNRAWHMKPLVFVDGSAVEHRHPFTRAP